MKKISFILVSFCLGAFITIGVMACANNDNPCATLPQNSSKVCVVEDCLEEHSGAWKKNNYTYDENGRILQVHGYWYMPEDAFGGGDTSGSSEPYTVSYHENTAVIKREGFYTLTIKFNKHINDCPVDYVNQQVMARISNYLLVI